ncbi:hypothetical protein HS1genome_1470 [Sulfodiicoccus acidiphilus]|uniref:Uncharacterized protein n=1 Tax=Sulfodiicoccus acidiphilus TaxID=1670455 RepID=A0A348B4H9_9CREN|nr:hypothetical protein [Sulfodiicoccus acidiphilus]BBD73081.1 hypothetical protein HS1genome_1470 [Sulfodiicoccus acidiphilus]GGU05255.1 hypothetical protein GCM10007116_22180 [Sulfodiicoccus acidiphilus]
MSEIDFLLKRREHREGDSRAQGAEGGVKNGETTQDPGGERLGPRAETRKVEGVDSRLKEEDIPHDEESRVKGTDSRNWEEVEKLMASFTSKEPKVGVWSYPAYLVLQYLYSTVPGFKVSRTAKEAMEMGLRQMYGDLFEAAERVARKYVDFRG